MDFTTKNSWKVDVEDSITPVLVEFTSPGCGPCRNMEQMLGRLSFDFEDKIKFYKINAWEEVEVFQEHKVGRVPTMVLFKDGKEVKRTGFTYEQEMYNWLNEGINGQEEKTA